MIGWMAGATLVAALLALATLAAERALALRTGSRWLWTAALAAAVALPVVGRLAPDGLDIVPGLDLLGALQAEGIAAVTPGPGSPPTPTERIDRALPGTWILLSATLAFVLLRVAARARHDARRGVATRIDGVEVRITRRTGPAVIGILRPRIVVPDWLLALSPEERRLALAHEVEHVRAGDTRLLALAAAAVVAMPWNPAIWWIARRVGHATENDCDARVLVDSDPARYGRLLIRVAGLDGVSPPAALSLVGPTGNLKRRILAMSSPRRRRRVAVAVPLLAVAGGALAVACDTASPPLAPEASETEAALATLQVTDADAATLDRWRLSTNVTSFVRFTLPIRISEEGPVEVTSNMPLEVGPTLSLDQWVVTDSEDAKKVKISAVFKD